MPSPAMLKKQNSFSEEASLAPISDVSSPIPRRVEGPVEKDWIFTRQSQNFVPALAILKGTIQNIVDKQERV